VFRERERRLIVETSWVLRKYYNVEFETALNCFPVKLRQGIGMEDSVEERVMPV
jgi:hypothetical protein